MKNSLRLLAILALFAGVSALAQVSPTRPPRHGPPPGEINSDGSITLPDGTVLPPPTFNDDGSVTLPDGTVLQPPAPHIPPVKNADGSLTLPDGTVVQPHADGTYTLPDGHVIDLTKLPPLPRRGGRSPRGPRPGGG